MSAPRRPLRAFCPGGALRAALRRSGPGAALRGGLGAAALALFTGCAALLPPPGPGVTEPPGPPPGVYETAAVAYYKPVPVPGTQRRAAQHEAEQRARRQVLEYIGSLQARPGSPETLLQMMSRHPQMRAKVLEFVRTTPVADWSVDPAAGCVQVIVQADLCRLQTILAEYGCDLPGALRGAKQGMIRR